MNAWIDNVLHFDELIQVFRIIIAIILGAAIGFEREKYGRPAGLRTHMIVCVASTLAMLISIFAFSSGDPARLAAQVISGIGFIGAGTIIRGDKDITGITTAATIWICAIIGLACGAGYYFSAIITTFSVLVILSAFVKIESKLSRSRKSGSTLTVLIKDNGDVVERLKTFLNDNKIAIKSLVFANPTLIVELNEFLANLDKEFAPINCKLSNETYIKNKH